MKPSYIQKSFINFSKDALTSEQMGRIIGGSGCICYRRSFGINGECACYKNAFRLWGGKYDDRSPVHFRP